jgi:hydroxyethylthiazole kinase
MRTSAALRLLEVVRPRIIRGNASEILALANLGSGTRGVDATEPVEGALAAAQLLSRTWDCVVTVSGPTDLVVQGERVARVHNGDPLMARVTGMGCTASALTGAFAAVNGDAFQAAIHAMVLMGVTGELAKARCQGPGSFQVAFLDGLASLRPEDLERLARVDGPA